VSELVSPEDARRGIHDRRGVMLAVVIPLVVFALLVWVVPALGDESATRVPGNRVGFAQAYSPTYESATALAREFDAISATGAKWVRFDVIWSQIQAEGPTSFDWRATDRAVRAAHARGLEVLGTLAYTPTWARAPGAPTDKYPPLHTADFSRFARAVALRYGPRGVHAFEIWNEPNTTFWAPRPDPSAYTKLLRSASRAIHRADGHATVVSGGLAAQGPTLDWVADDGTGMSPLHFLQAMYAHGAHGTFDALGFHPYGIPGGPEGSGGWNAFAQTPALHAEMRAHGDGDRLIWGTEVGAYTGSGEHAVTEAVQARYLVDYVTLWRQWPYTGPLFLYTLRDRSRKPANGEDHFGVLRVDYSRKPAYDALRRLIG
jgi:polysaccharide biosynthesis protein PslG